MILKGKLMRKLSELIKNLTIEQIIGEIDMEISSIQYDSRKSENDALFVAITGNQVDGHDYIQKAIEKGATVIVCERIDENIDYQPHITFLLVKNSRIALANLSHNYYGNPTKDLKVIGVTGTNGKTTITFLLKSIFESAGEKVGIIGTTGIFIGDEKVPATHTTPESLELCSIFNEMKEKGVTIVAIEVSSHSLDQHRVDGINFNAALFTNLTHDHLDYHSNYENYANAKKMLFDMLPEDSVAIVNADDEYGNYMLQDCISRHKYTIGRKQKTEDRSLKSEDRSLNPEFGSLTIEGTINTPDFIIKNENLGIDFSEFTLTMIDMKPGTGDWGRETVASLQNCPSTGENEQRTTNNEQRTTNNEHRNNTPLNPLSRGELENEQRTTNIEHRTNSSLDPLSRGEVDFSIRTKLLGRFNIDNAGICAALAHSMRLENSAICDGLLSSNGAPGRMHRIILKNGAVAIVDYAHTPDALEKALNACRDIIISSGCLDSRLICVFGCGGDRDNTKRPVMGRIASSIADYAIITSDNPRTEDPDKIIEEIYDGIDKAHKNKVVQLTNRHEAIKYAVSISNSKDLILVAGKGHEDYQIIGKQKFHFSDIEELEKFVI
jgi:UDP-N-acetylmuramyl tripeptide synthase